MIPKPGRILEALLFAGRRTTTHQRLPFQRPAHEGGKALRRCIHPRRRAQVSFCALSCRLAPFFQVGSPHENFRCSPGREGGGKSGQCAGWWACAIRSLVWRDGQAGGAGEFGLAFVEGEEGIGAEDAGGGDVEDVEGAETGAGGIVGDQPVGVRVEAMDGCFAPDEQALHA